MERIKYGLIGTGAMGHGHLFCLNNMEQIDVVAAADPHEESLENARKNNATPDACYFSDYHELLAQDDVQAVVIAAPDYLHAEIVEDALAAGKHVLSEKPAATTHEDLDRLEAVVKKAKTVYQVGLELRYMPSFVRTVEMIHDKGIIGKPQIIWCLEFRGPFLKKVGDWIIRQEYTGGAWVEKMCHYFDLVAWFAGAKPKRVSSFAGQDLVTEVGGAPQNVIDNGWASIEFDNNTRATLGLAMFMERGAGVMEVSALGPKGSLTAQMNSITHKSVADRSTITYDATPPTEIQKYSHNGGVYYEHLEFIDCIREGRSPKTNFEVARYSTLMGLAAEQSRMNGGAVVPID